MEATIAPIGELSAEELAVCVRSEQDQDRVARAGQELQRRAGDGEEDAIEALEALASEKGEALAGKEERKAELEAEQAELDQEGVQDDAAAAQGLSQEEYMAKLNAERDADPTHPPATGVDTAVLPTAADDDGPSADLEVGGDGTQLTFSGFAKSVGGKKPSESKVRLTGGAFAVSKGAFAKGSTVIFEVKARIQGVSFEDIIDSKTQQPVDCVRSHKARIVGAVRVDADTAGRLEELQGAVRAYLEGNGTPEETTENDLRGLVGMAPVETNVG